MISLKKECLWCESVGEKLRSEWLLAKEMEWGWQTRPSGEGQCVMSSRSELGSIFDADVPAGHIKANYHGEETLPIHRPPHSVSIP